MSVSIKSFDISNIPVSSICSVVGKSKWANKNIVNMIASSNRYDCGIVIETFVEDTLMSNVKSRDPNSWETPSMIPKHAIETSCSGWEKHVEAVSSIEKNYFDAFGSEYPINVIEQNNNKEARTFIRANVKHTPREYNNTILLNTHGGAKDVKNDTKRITSIAVVSPNMVPKIESIYTFSNPPFPITRITVSELKAVYNADFLFLFENQLFVVVYVWKTYFINRMDYKSFLKIWNTIVSRNRCMVVNVKRAMNAYDGPESCIYHKNVIELPLATIGSVHWRKTGGMFSAPIPLEKSNVHTKHGYVEIFDERHLKFGSFVAVSATCSGANYNIHNVDVVNAILDHYENNWMIKNAVYVRNNNSNTYDIPSECEVFEMSDILSVVTLCTEPVCVVIDAAAINITYDMFLRDITHMRSRNRNITTIIFNTDMNEQLAQLVDVYFTFSCGSYGVPYNEHIISVRANTEKSENYYRVPKTKNYNVWMFGMYDGELQIVTKACQTNKHERMPRMFKSVLNDNSACHNEIHDEIITCEHTEEECTSSIQHVSACDKYSTDSEAHVCDLASYTATNGEKRVDTNDVFNDTTVVDVAKEVVLPTKKWWDVFS